ncbi:MAG TPA: terminase gpA endonuclease subunit [Pyrinomonadaceae bacterium]|jgi:hypothetical protein
MQQLSRTELFERIMALPPDLQDQAIDIAVELYSETKINPATGEEARKVILSPLAWAIMYRQIEGQAFSLDYKPASETEPATGYEPLREIYDDDHPFIVVMKPAQVGVSELAITRALHALDIGAQYWKTSNDGLNVGYLFPTQEALFDFSKERISALKDESEKLDKFFDDYDDVRFKKAGKSYFYMRGAWSVKALKSFKADVLILDERDEMLPRAVALAVKRLRHSQVKRQFRLSTPTFPGFGIHDDYLKSDQREWEVRCSLCDAWNTLSFHRDVKVNGAAYDEWKKWDEERIHQGTITVSCPNCKEPMQDADRFGPGRWIARHPEITRTRGYHVPWFAFPSVSLRELCISSISTDPEQIIEFYRSDLGIPYDAADSRVTEAMLKQLSADLDNGLLPDGPWRDVTMGVDVGAHYHYRISGTGTDKKRYVLAMGSVNSWDDLDDLMVRYKVRHVVVDAMPELHGAEAWSQKHKGKVFRAFYKDLKGELFKLPSAEEKEMHGIKVSKPKVLKKDIVQVDRTMAMDTIYNLIAGGREVWPAAVHNDSEVIAHMSAPVRKVTTNDEGQPFATWVHTKPDHLFHAAVYDLIAQRTLPRHIPGALVQGSTKIPM